MNNIDYFGQELDSLIGLAKANEEIKDYFITQILEAFEDDIYERVEQTLRDLGWRQPL